MATKITKKWADSVADGSHEMYVDMNTKKPNNVEPFLGLTDLYREGQSRVEVRAKLGVSATSYNKACTISRKFKEAHTAGLQRSEAWWMTLGRAGAAGKTKIQPATWIFNMKNRFNYSDKRELTTKAGGDNIEETTIKPEMTAEDAAKLYQAEILKKV